MEWQQRAAGHIVRPCCVGCSGPRCLRHQPPQTTTIPTKRSLLDPDAPVQKLGLRKCGLNSAQSVSPVNVTCERGPAIVVGMFPINAIYPVLGRRQHDRSACWNKCVAVNSDELLSASISKQTRIDTHRKPANFVLRRFLPRSTSSTPTAKWGNRVHTLLQFTAIGSVAGICRASVGVAP